MRTIEESIDDLLHDIESFIGGNITERQNELLNEILEIHKEEKRPKGNCETCKARKLCEEKYPDGVWASFDCKRLIKKWLKMERES